MLGFGGFS